jgi:DNA-binding Lrp family transcriptional regulator
VDDTDKKILETINAISPKSFISPVKVNEVLKLDANKLGKRLMHLKKSGQIDIMTSEYPSSLSLPNGISRVYLTDLGRENLAKKR